MADGRRLFGMLGFAMRAGKLIIGTEQVAVALRKRGSVKLAVYTASASEPSKKRILSKCEFYGVKAVQINISPEELGAHLGKSFAPVCIGVTDEGFAKEIAEAAGDAIEVSVD